VSSVPSLANASANAPSIAWQARAGRSQGTTGESSLKRARAYRHLEYGRGDFPVAEELSDEVIYLPMFPGPTSEQQTFVVNQLGGAVAQ
jgi:dTDP-4-amino-4,6-dideoxygalactose transaminase